MDKYEELDEQLAMYYGEEDVKTLGENFSYEMVS